MLLDELKPRRELAKLRMAISAERVKQKQALDAFGMAQGIGGRDRSAPVLWITKVISWRSSASMRPARFSTWVLNV